MIPLVKLRENLRFAKELQEMVEVLKWATASQFRGLQQKKKGFEEFKIRIEDFLSILKTCHIRHSFLTERANLPKAVMMITSDDGFVGSLNALVVNAALEQVSDRDELIVVGERGARYLSETQNRAFTFLPGISDDITYKRAGAVRDLLIGKVLKREVGRVIVVYPRFLSLTIQRVDMVKILPCDEILKQEFQAEKTPSRPEHYLIEPTQSSVVDYLVKMWIMQKIYEIFWDSKLSECAARIIHLEGSYEESLNTNKKLMYDYFKHLHARSDKNIREIFASRLSLK